MRVVFTRLAKQELDETVQKYEMEFAGLGSRFRNEIKKATHRIATHPKAWSAKTRTCVSAFCMPFLTTCCIPLNRITSW